MAGVIEIGSKVIEIGSNEVARIGLGAADIELLPLGVAKVGWIDMANFTPISALVGGVLIGLAAAVLIIGIGRIMGMSGIVNNAITGLPGVSWQLVFILGMAVATWGYSLKVGFPDLEIGQPYWKIILAGLLVGFGTRLGSGCTSGHGICGISRLSLRSIIATFVFLASGMVTATLFAIF